jgi:signal transduction histidine kinase
VRRDVLTKARDIVLRLVDAGLPDTLKRDPDTQLRARVVMLGCLLGLPVASTFTVDYALNGAHALAITYAITLICVTLLPPQLARSQRLGPPTHQLLGAISSNAVVCSWLLGGIDPSCLAWLVMMPITANMVLGRRAGLLWMGISTSALVGLITLLELGVTPPVRPLPPTPALDVFGHTSLMLCIVLHGVLYDELTLRALSSAEKARADAREAVRAAEADDEAKARFLARVGDTLHTPLHRMLEATRQLQDGSLPEIPSEYARVAERSGEALLAVIDDLRDVATELTLAPAPCDVRELWGAVDDVLRGRVKKAVTLQVDLDESLPPALLIDSARLRQVLLNLVGNALKFTDAGRVDVRLAYEDGQLALRVCDTGPGIAPERHRAVLEPFVQEDVSTTRRYGGSGLGLTITRNLIEAMGGELELISAPGNGATFQTSLPVPIVPSTTSALRASA